MQLNKNRNILGTSISEFQRKERVNIYSCQYAVLNDILFSCSHTDGMVTATRLSVGKVVQNIKHPYGKVKCLTLSDK